MNTINSPRTKPLMDQQMTHGPIPGTMGAPPPMMRPLQTSPIVPMNTAPIAQPHPVSSMNLLPRVAPPMPPPPLMGSPNIPSHASMTNHLGAGPPPPQPIPTTPSNSSTNVTSVPTMTTENKVLDKRRLQELVKEVDPLEQLDDDVEEVLMTIADDFIDNVVNNACILAKHRKSNTLDVKDVQLHLERNWNMWVPGFGSEDIRPYKKVATTEAHKQRMALIRKTLKKY